MPHSHEIALHENIHPSRSIESTPVKSLILVALLLLMGARRVALTLMLAVVLSSLEIERRGSIRQPAPIVVMLDKPPHYGGRSRPYRAHHRRTAPVGW